MLGQIRAELQYLIEAIKAVTRVDITITDNQFMRIAGTGRLKEEIGNFIPENSAYHKCFRSGESQLINLPRENSICSQCAARTTCQEVVELCIPITYDHSTIGVLGMCTFNAEVKSSILESVECYFQLQQALNRLISSMLNAQIFQNSLFKNNYEMKVLVDSLNDGVIILSPKLIVKHINTPAKTILDIQEEQSILTSRVLPGSLIQKLDSCTPCELGPIQIKNENYVINLKPVTVSGEYHGIVLIFSDFQKMKHKVLAAHSMHDHVSFDSIIGESEAIRSLKEKAKQIACTDAAVLITGETGTGKELFAKAIHMQSKRKDNIFLALNCGAIPSQLVESELFGYEKGAFTGASAQGKIGLIEVAKNGTLFLDEIGELPPDVQVKLLRAIEEREIFRVGGTSPLYVNPRIIAATNKCLREMIKDKTFREDLYYRLNVIEFNIPPLRERGGDILLLARYYLNKYAGIYEKAITKFSAESEALLLRHPFHGNIRELKNLAEYCVIMTNMSEIDAETVSFKLSGLSGQSRLEDIKPLDVMVQDYERSVIRTMVSQRGQTAEAKSRVAKDLGISISTLYRKLAEK
jgi:transcriptional regulator with PAS, ATPase and Fis domain